MSTLITLLHIIVCLFLMLTVLLQSGKGGGMGAAFGGGNAATVFGSSGASGFLKRLTAIAGTIFMATSMVLAFLASHNSADALQKWGEKQQQIADEKEKARAEGLQGGSGAGSGAGSAAGPASLTPFTPSAPGSTAPLTPAPAPATPAPPAETPAAPAAPAEKPPAPAAPPASSTPNAPKP